MNKPHWIVQSNLGSTGNYEAMMGHSVFADIPFTGVKIRPFTDDVPVDVGGPIVVYGSCGMVRAANNTALSRGVFANPEGFKFRALREGYREALLNHDAVVWTVKDFFTQWRGGEGPFFIRGNDDEKYVVGHVATRSAFKKDILNRFDILPEYEIMISKPRKIYREFRCWSVDGQIVAGSPYGGGGNKLDNNWHQSNFKTSDAMGFAQEAVKVYAPHKIFVIDICDSEDGPAIVELNGFNSAGFYEANICAIMDAVNSSTYYK